MPWIFGGSKVARLEWIPALGTGNSGIDEEHKTLFALINKLDAAREREGDLRSMREVADELVQYVHVHFSHEESLFEAKGYPGAAPHVEEHRAFVARVAQFHAQIIDGSQAVGAEMAEFLRTWLSRHIALSDRKYRPWLADRAEGEGRD